MNGPCHAHENRGYRNWDPTLQPPFFAAKRRENFGISMLCDGGNGKKNVMNSLSFQLKTETTLQGWDLHARHMCVLSQFPLRRTRLRH